MEPFLSSTALSSVLVDLLTRLLARRTAPGKAQLILSESEIDEGLRKELNVGTDQRDDSVRALRNELVHATITTTNYDDALELATFVHQIGRMPSTDELAADSQSLVHSYESPAKEPGWLDVAGIVAEAFVQQLLMGSADLEKLDPDEARAMGRRAAESALAAARWSQVVGDRLNTTAVADLLGISRQALAKRQAAGSLLGLPGNGTTWYPTWQFDLLARKVRPEVRQVIGAFRDRLDEVEPMAIASWAATDQAEDLDGLSPREWIKSGRDAQRLRTAADRAASRLSQ